MSSSSQVFPLFSLPCLAMEEVLRHLTPIELLSLSMIEKSYLRQTIRRLTRRNPVDLCVYFVPTKKLFCFCPTGGLKPEAIDLSVPTPDYSDASGGYTHFLNLVTDRFHTKSISFHIDDSSDFKMMGLMKDAVAKGLQLVGLLIRARELPFSVSYFLSKCTREASLQLYSTQSRSLLAHQFSKSLSLQWIRIREGAGLRLSTLMSMMHCRKVEVSRVFIEGDKLNRLLRRWMREPEYRLEEMELRFDLHRLNTNWKIMEGIEAVQMHDNCYRIQRRDGVNATVFFTEQLFLMKVYRN